MNTAVRARIVVVFLALIVAGPVLASLKGTNTTLWSWNEATGKLNYANSNVSLSMDGKWHPFWASLSFDTGMVTVSDFDGDGRPNTDVDGNPIQCSATDTDGNGIVGTSGQTQWAGTLQLSVDARKAVGDPINGFQATRCWQLTACDRGDLTNGLLGTFSSNSNGADLSRQTRFDRYIADITDNETAVCRSGMNQDFGLTVPTQSNGFITLISKDEPSGVCAGNCAEALNTVLFVNLDRDCDGTIDMGATPGDPSVIGEGGAGLIPRPAASGEPEVCFYAEAKKPSFLVNPQWGSGNIQARITAPAGGSGDKTVNHKFLANPTTGDVGDLPSTYPIAAHVTNSFAGNPFIGTAPDTETVTYNSTTADLDDATDTFDEGGIILPPDTITDSDGSDAIYTVSVPSTNNSGAPAMVCGWFDFNQDGTLNNDPNTSSTSADPAFGTAAQTENGERSCAAVPDGSTNAPIQLSWTLPLAVRETNTGDFYLRFRITNDPDVQIAEELSPSNPYDAGEVEDYRLQTVGTLPVSIATFSSAYTAEGLAVEWTTASETRNVGFHVWGDRGAGLELLNAELVPAEVGDPGEPRGYALVIPGIARGEVSNLAVTAVDFHGDEEVYGLFEPGHDYGREAKPATIPWNEIRDHANRRAGLHRAERKRQAALLSAAGGSIKPDRADVRVIEPGLQEITWQMLADAGLDLTGARPEDIAVTFKGRPVARHVIASVTKTDARGTGAGWNTSGRTTRFGPGSVIRFWGDAPGIEDALYIEHNVYRVSLDAARARPATEQGRGAGLLLVDRYTEWQRVNEQNSYHFMAPGSDPWYAQLLRSDRSAAYEAAFSVDGNTLSASPARLKVSLGGLTAYDEAPDHHAQVFVNGQLVADRFFDGNREHDIEVELPAGLITTGENVVRITAAGGQAAPRDLFVVDTIEIGYPRTTAAQNGRLLIENFDDAGLIRADGFGSDEVVAYAHTADGLVRLQHHTRNDGTIIAPTVAEDGANYWLSDAGRVARPQVLSAARNQNLLAGPTADFLVIAHPAFLPVSAGERHPLNDYLAQRRSEGWKPRAFDITEIQAEYGHGMALPEALTAFLAAADKRFDYQHVLLVGNDSYDYLDRIGRGVISFIPTRYAPTRYIDHTPSDALLADLDGDGLSDKAIGRWPVRTTGDLQAIVTKTLDWPNIANPQSAIWLTDSEDGRNAGFAAQADRMLGQLEQAGWNEDLLDRVYFSDVEIKPGLSVADSARAEYFDKLEQGRALTGFIGHGAPSMWSFQGLLGGNDLAELANEGNPTLIGTQACYTTYFVSTTSDAVAHRWMNGYRLDAAGNRIPGAANGAVAVHGAATLSDYNQNERFAREVLKHQLEGDTLGQATLEARRHAQQTGMKDLVINWTLLGDPTLKTQDGR